MDGVTRLADLNRSLQRLLGLGEPARLPAVHDTDDLLVRVLAGGKDVGKSTFLNALLGAEVSPDPPDVAEGTSRFIAYVHAERADELQARLEGRSLHVQMVTHRSETHRRLCLVDSPDFDSRYPHHAAQVERFLSSGTADGVILLSSPAKYKDRAFWESHAALSERISPDNILFVLTKADELGDFADEVRLDFSRTVANATPAVGGGTAAAGPGTVAGGIGSAPAGGATPTVSPDRIFLIDSLRRGADFERLEQRLLRPLSSRDVSLAQADNRRHAFRRGLEALEQHYGLAETARRLEEAADPERVEGAFDAHFPPSYFQTVETRLAGDEEIRLLVRRHTSARMEKSLAGIPTILSAARWLSGLTALRLGFGRNAREGGRDPGGLVRLLRWGRRDLEDRLARAREAVCLEAGLETPEALAPFLASARLPEEDLDNLLADTITGLRGRGFAWPVRLLLNLPVYLYLALFILILLHPLFLLLGAWGITPLPELGRVLTLDNVKVSVIGLVGYYVMAAFFVFRRNRVRLETLVEETARRFADNLRDLLLDSSRRPLDLFRGEFERLQRMVSELEP